MLPQSDYSVICPIDPENPFRNPTEEPCYTPDYSAILPDMDMPDAALLLNPPPEERKNIRRYYEMTFLMLLFCTLTALTIFTLIRLIAVTVIQQHDLRILGELPQNYGQIVQQFFDDSSITYASNLIAFLCANVFTVLIGCKLTNLRGKDFFRTRKCSVSRVMMYIFIGLLIQLAANYLAEWLISLTRGTAFALSLPAMHTGGSAKRTAMLILYGVLAGPVTEELLMRGFVLKNLSRVSQRFGIVMTALLFGIMHDNLLQFLYTFPLGLLLGYITVRHNSVAPALAVHITVNAFALAQDFCMRSLAADVSRTVQISATLAVLAFGTVSLLYLFAAERMPARTPHQSTRCGRIVLSSPLLWIFVIVHIAAGILTAR